MRLLPPQPPIGGSQLHQPATGGSQPSQLAMKRALLGLLPLLLAFGLAVSGLGQESLWHDEAWSMWAVRGSLAETVRRVATDVHPPLYFVLLRLWTLLAGESAFSVRLLSAQAGLLGVALTCAIGRRLFDSTTGLAAAVLLATNGFWLYYSGETRMYSLLLGLACLSTWLYLGWLARPTPARLAAYGLAAALLGYTHYYGLLVPLTHGLHLLLARPRRLKGWLLAGALAGGLYLPWLPLLIRQVQANPDGPLTMPIPTNLATIGWLLAVLSGGAGGWALVPWLLGRALPRLRRHGRAVLLLALWAAVTPAIILALNSWRGTLYESRYVIGCLPAISLLVAYALRQMSWRPLAILLLGWLVYANLASFRTFWPPRAPYGETMARVVAARRPAEPSLLMIVEPHSLEAYYDRELGLANQNTLALSGRRYSPAEIRQLIAPLAPEPAVWLMMPYNLGETWAAMAALDRGRVVGYRAGGPPMLFYRFDKTGPGPKLRFSFGRSLRYDGPLFASSPAPPAGGSLCPELRLVALADLDGSYAFGLHLVDPANRLVAQHDESLGRRAAGEPLRLRPCLALPPGLAPGLYYLHLVVYTPADGRRLPVLEGGPDGVFWGDALIFEWVESR